MDLAREINASLRVLGLGPGATEADVRSAFRRLARTCHPDVVGRSGASRFQQITSAYSLLKGLAPDELNRLTHADPGSRREIVKRGQSTFLDWYHKRRERWQEEAEAARRAAAEEEERQAAERSERVDHVLDQYDRNMERRLERMARNADQAQISDILSRLKSSVPEVRRLALGRVGVLANRSEVRQAVSDLLCRWEVDEATARLVAGLPLKPDVLHRLAYDVASKAADFPNSLISSLLNLRNPNAVMDPLLMERYLSSGSPECIALVLRCWPAGNAPSEGVLRRLLESGDEQILAPVLSAMKQNFPQVAPQFKKRLTELLEHSTPAVRVWCRVLLAL